MNKKIESGLVLAGFLGIGTPGKGVYQSTRYLFEDQCIDNELDEVHLFSVALQKYLKRSGRAPRLWLVMGTEKSIWEALAEVVEDLEFDSTRHEEFDTQVQALQQKPVSQEQLDKWSETLTERTGVPTLCCLVEASGSEEGQNQIWQILQKYIQDGDDVIFDITNGLRHQPIIASYSVMFLRWLRNVGRIDFCYGVLGTEGKPGDAVFLPLCEDLTKACEAFVRYKFTGDFRGIGNELRLGEDFNESLGVVAYTDQMNRPQQETAKELLSSIEGLADKFSPLAKELSVFVKDSLSWVAHSRLDRQYERKAEKAFECQQYFQAIAYLYEAIVLADCYAHTRGNFLIFGVRTRRIKRPKSIRGQPKPLTLLEETLNEKQLRVFNRLSFLRNSVLHGTKSDDENLGAEVENAIVGVEHLEPIFTEGRQLFKELSYPANHRH